MLNPTVIPARNLQKFYKTIIQGVKAGKQAVVLTTNNEPQAALISLEDLEELKRARNKQAALDMLKLAADSKEELKSVPANLREKADELLYSQSHD